MEFIDSERSACQKVCYAGKGIFSKFLSSNTYIRKINVDQQCLSIQSKDLKAELRTKE